MTHQSHTKFVEDKRYVCINFHKICEAPLRPKRDEILGAGGGTKRRTKHERTHTRRTKQTRWANKQRPNKGGGAVRLL